MAPRRAAKPIAGLPELAWLKAFIPSAPLTPAQWPPIATHLGCDRLDHRQTMPSRHVQACRDEATRQPRSSLRISALLLRETAAGSPRNRQGLRSYGSQASRCRVPVVRRDNVVRLCDSVPGG